MKNLSSLLALFLVVVVATTGCGCAGTNGTTPNSPYAGGFAGQLSTPDRTAVAVSSVSVNESGVISGETTDNVIGGLRKGERINGKIGNDGHIDVRIGKLRLAGQMEIDQQTRGAGVLFAHGEVRDLDDPPGQERIYIFELWTPKS